MIDFRVRSGLAAGLILFLFFGGCVKKVPVETEIAPEVEAVEEEPVVVDETWSEEEAAQAAITQAETDISDAVNSGAKRYAGELLSSAESMLISAKNAFEEEDFLKAKKDAEESSSLANEAKSLAVKKIEEEKLLSKEEREKARLEKDRIARAKLERERSRKERLEREGLERKRLEKERLEAEAKSAEMLAEEKERARRQLLRKRNRVVVVGVILIVLIGLVIRAVVQKGKKVQ